MSATVIVILVFAAGVALLGAFGYAGYRKNLHRAKSIERGLKMVPLLIHLPPPSDDVDKQQTNRNVQDIIREKTSQAEVLYGLVAGTFKKGFSSKFYGQRHLAFEIVATDGLVHYYAAVPVAMVSTIEQAIVSAYPGARVEETEDHNIFSQAGRLSGTVGGELALKEASSYPIATYNQLERDPMEALLNTLANLSPGEGAAVQFVIRPASPIWVRASIALAKRKRRLTGTSSTSKSVGGYSIGEIALAPLKAPKQRRREQREYAQNHPMTGLEESAVQAIEEKTRHPAFEVMVRLLVSTAEPGRSQAVLAGLANSFSLFEAPGWNGFQFLPAVDVQGLVTAYIFRFFPPTIHSTILNSVELATLFHLPDFQFTPTRNVDRQMSKQADGPPMLPTTGLLLGSNIFRDTKKDIRLSPEDRRRHMYMIGQTGTGKSTMLENLVVQDMLNGNGFAFIDPHGDSAEKLLGLVPKERAEDVIYFNPADMDFPLGLNLFEFEDPTEKDFIIQESINMLYKIHDPNHTGIIGPRFEQWYRNAALTLMSDPGGSTFIEIPQVFTDTEYLKRKFKYLTDPTVIDFWTKEMGQTSDYHKSEMLGYFSSKFGAFLQNEMMRNILGQTKSSLNLKSIMDNKKILIANLSKGRLGEENARLLGMIFVIKFQAAAMSRASMLESERQDFCLYVDEFQNFSTDSFATILSEARKYRLNLIVANQFIGQLTDQIREAVFGNIGTMVSYRCGPEDAEFLVKQFAPIFDARDLVNLPNFNSVVKLLIGGLPSQPFSMLGLPYLTNSNPDLALAIKQLSAAKFGRDRAHVEAEIYSRLTGQPMATPAPPKPAPVPSAAAAPGVAPAPPTPAQVPAPVTTPPPPLPAPAASALPVPVSAPTAPPAPVQSATSTTPAPAGPSIADIVKQTPSVAKDAPSAPPTPPPLPMAQPPEPAAVLPPPPQPAAPPKVREVPLPPPPQAPASAPQPATPPNRASMPPAPMPMAAPAPKPAPTLLPTPPPISAPPIGAPPIDLPADIAPAPRPKATNPAPAPSQALPPDVKPDWKAELLRQQPPHPASEPPKSNQFSVQPATDRKAPSVASNTIKSTLPETQPEANRPQPKGQPKSTLNNERPAKPAEPVQPQPMQTKKLPPKPVDQLPPPKPAAKPTLDISSKTTGPKKPIPRPNQSQTQAKPSSPKPPAAPNSAKAQSKIVSDRQAYGQRVEEDLAKKSAEVEEIVPGAVIEPTDQLTSAELRDSMPPPGSANPNQAVPDHNLAPGEVMVDPDGTIHQG